SERGGEGDAPTRNPELGTRNTGRRPIGDPAPRQRSGADAATDREDQAGEGERQHARPGIELRLRLGDGELGGNGGKRTHRGNAEAENDRYLRREGEVGEDQAARRDHV